MPRFTFHIFLYDENAINRMNISPSYHMLAEQQGRVLSVLSLTENKKPDAQTFLPVISTAPW